VMSVPGPRDRVLILGGGDGMAAREALKYPDVKTIDLVDIDPAVTDLCRDFPPLRQANEDSLRNPKVTIHNTDAFTFIQPKRERYDRVIIDLPAPHNESLSKLYSVQFYRGLAKRMTGEGSSLDAEFLAFFHAGSVLGDRSHASGSGVFDIQLRSACAVLQCLGIYTRLIGQARADQIHYRGAYEIPHRRKNRGRRSVR
jgi:spermidine synthase